MPTTKQGELLAEGKTKKIWEVEGSTYCCIIESKDDITAGDGAKHDVLRGKGALSCRTTTNVFRLLEKCGVPIAFLEELDKARFLARRCAMIPYEVVVRREAHGSYLKRHPEIKKGHVFPHLIVELFLKTSEKRWGEIDLPGDDPLVQIVAGSASLFLPDQPIYNQSPFLTLDDFPLEEMPDEFATIKNMAVRIFLILEKAWQIAGYRLADIKMEMGKTAHGTLILADVIDNESWRLIDEEENYMDKQLYREGANLKTVKSAMQRVLERSRQFNIPRQQIILWRGSERDDFEPFVKALWEYCGDPSPHPPFRIRFVTCSMHKEPVRACRILAQLVQEVPDSVVISYVGKSNGAGPTLSAQTHVPVITVPASWQEFSQDIWSSLRVPSNTPVMTILDTKNAALAALQILAIRNPAIYAALRMKQEERFSNVVEL